jgi:hypothetical protein
MDEDEGQCDFEDEERMGPTPATLLVVTPPLAGTHSKAQRAQGPLSASASAADDYCHGVQYSTNI